MSGGNFDALTLQFVPYALTKSQQRIKARETCTKILLTFHHVKQYSDSPSNELVCGNPTSANISYNYANNDNYDDFMQFYIMHSIAHWQGH